MKSYEEIKKEIVQNYKKNKRKKYMHFDKPLGAGKINALLQKFQEIEYVKSYRHLPYIQFNIRFNKYGYGNSKINKKAMHTKLRKITLSSHHDALLFKYYGSILASCYEEYVMKNDLDELAVAYRKNRSNVSGAKETFDFIWKTGDSWIIKGDFSNFFDNLNHQILMKNVKKVICNITGKKLSEDWVSVLNAVTKFRVIQKSELRSKNIKNGKYFENLEQLHKCIKSKKLHISSTNYKGIPQGTAISAVLANVYMIEFDKSVQELTRKYKGFYRRYSDDFTISLPEKNCDFDEVLRIWEKIKSLCQKKILLSIKKEKTEVLHFVSKEEKIYRENTFSEKNFEFLGFCFTGKTVFLRSKTLYKYHYKGKHAIHLLIRNMNERDIGLSKNYEEDKKEYLKRISGKKQRKISERLDEIKDEVQKGYSLRGRKKITYMYLVNRPIKMKNMRYYTDIAEKKLEVPIPGIESLYNVKVKCKVTKKIGQFQRMFGKMKKERKNF